jgi:uncharacterized protein involved in exopolysaccharide biosynthesis
LDLKLRQSEQAGLKANLLALNEQKEAVLADLRTVNDHELRLDELSRQADLARSSFMQYAQDMEAARVDKELENDLISNLSIPQPATLTEKPVSPLPLLVLFATLVFATAGTGALVLASELLNQPTPELYRVAMDTAPTLRRRVQRRALTAKANGESQVGERLPAR